MKTANQFIAIHWQRQITFVVSLLVLLTLESCKKIVTVEPPVNLAITSKVFSSDQTAIAAMLNIYISMNNSTINSFHTSVFLGLAADEFKNYSTNGTFLNFYTNQYNPYDNPSLDFWKYGYNIIYQANAVYEGCNQSSSLTTEVKRQLMAEALFVRAYWHFYLVNLYGRIPLVTTTDYLVNRATGRISVDQVYTSIINDLKAAEENLSEEYLNGDTKTITLDRIRPNRYVASALLARVYLFNKQYALAEEHASKVINRNVIYKLSTANTAFANRSTEAIWQLQLPLPNATTVNTFDALNYILTAKPSTTTIRCVTISDALFNSFEPNDQRKTNWIGSSMSLQL